MSQFIQTEYIHMISHDVWALSYNCSINILKIVCVVWKGIGTIAFNKNDSAPGSSDKSRQYRSINKYFE